MYEVLAPETAGGNSNKTARDLEELLGSLFYEDGVGTEHSAHYQANTLEWVLIAHRVAQLHGVELSVGEHLKAGSEFLSLICSRTGQFFDFGDNDSSVVLRQTLRDELLPRSVAGSICAQFNHRRPPQGWTSGLREMFLDIPEPSTKSSLLSSGRLFPDGGYTILKVGEQHVLFDHAPLGFHSTAGHGHADALAVWLFYKDRPVWVDWGTYRYNGDPKWRTKARSTSSHNTLQIDQCEQSEMVGGFNWRRRAECQLLRYSKDRSIVRARHNGFAPLGIVHQREVDVREKTIVVSDIIEGSGIHRCLIRYWLAPQFDVLQRDGMLIVHSEHMSASVDIQPSNNELWGLSVEEHDYSPRYQVLRKTKVIVMSARLVLPAQIKMVWCWDD